MHVFFLELPGIKPNCMSSMVAWSRTLLYTTLSTTFMACSGSLVALCDPHDMGSLFKAAKTLAEGLGQQPAPAPSAGAVSREKVEAHFQDIWTINRPGIDLSVVDQVEQRPVRRRG